MLTISKQLNESSDATIANTVVWAHRRNSKALTSMSGVLQIQITKWNHSDAHIYTVLKKLPAFAIPCFCFVTT